MKRAWLVVIVVAVMAVGCAAPRSATDVTPPIVDTGANPDAWVEIPAGEFLMGIHRESVDIPGAYEMMVNDVTNAQYADYLNAALAAGKVKIAGDAVVGPYAGDTFRGVKHEKEIEAGDWPHVPLNDPSLRLTFDGKAFAVKAGYENHPMTVVTWFGAKAYCEFYGARLPAEAEWEKAARGTDGRPYPWGDEVARNNANYYASLDPFEQGLGGQGNTTPVGFYNGQAYQGYQTLDSPSPYGLYDMAGNVWQWTADIYEGAHYRTMRGGSKGNYGYNLRVWSRNSAEPDYAGPSVGFRCAR
ncbi:MAG: formylglycine-generating enzyme family protein [Thermoflexales bacterium]|nr:formylglycine-generating enzyme family protein [Thermoflexales bacterium]